MTDCKKIMQRLAICLLPLSLLPPVASAGMPQPSPAEDSTIAFGSCLRQWQGQPIWHSITALAPRAFVFLGDNMYSDVGEYLALAEPGRIQKAYADLSATEDFKEFLSVAESKDVSLFATWDDHDYGTNDGGADYRHKLASKKYFLDFFRLENTVSGDESQPGIYQSHRLVVADLDIQLIMLDTRSFRSPIQKDPNDETCPNTRTVANNALDATVLGDDQWQWLGEELKKPADLRIIASSIQVIPEQHCFEKWANFPREREKFFELIRNSNANGVLLISGDRHLAEISKLPETTVGYPIYEITSSGLNSAMGVRGALINEENRFRIQDNVFDDNFGSIAIRRENKIPMIEMRIHKSNGKLARSVTVPLSSLSF